MKNPLGRAILCGVGIAFVQVLAMAGVQEEAGVAIVEVPVYVTDSGGNPVIDLEQAEFSVYEDGKKQELVFVQLIGAGTGEVQAGGGSSVESRRHFVLFFDLTFNETGGLKRARDASIDFVRDQLSGEDLAAVFSFSVSEGVVMHTNFTADRRQLVDAISSLGLTRGRNFLSDSAFLSPQPDPQVQEGASSGATTRTADTLFDEQTRIVQMALARQDTLAYRHLVGDYLSDIGDFARSLDVLAGRKYVIYFSSGFDAKILGGQTPQEAAADTERIITGSFAAVDPSAREHDTNLIDLLNRAMSQFSSSDCRIYCIDPSGLASSADPPAQQPPQRGLSDAFRKQTALQMFATETGGKLYKNQNDLSGPLGSVVGETRHYYLLAYSAPPVKGNGTYHKIEVDVARPGLSVSFRKGYYESRPFSAFTDLERNLQIADIFNKDRHVEAIDLNLQTMVFPGGARESRWKDFARVVVQAAIPGGQFQDRKKDLDIDLYGFATAPGKTVVDYFHGRFKIKLSELRERVLSHGINYTDLLLLPPGDYTLKIIIRDNESGATTARDVPVSVANFDAPSLHMATPCFVSVNSDWVNVRGFDPAKPPKRLSGAGVEYPLTVQNRACAPTIYPNLAEDRDHLMLVKLYNVPLDDRTNTPKAGLAWEIVDAEGRSLGAPSYSLAQGNRLDEHSYELLFKVRSPELERGLYWLRLRAFDRLSGASTADTVPFFVE